MVLIVLGDSIWFLTLWCFKDTHLVSTLPYYPLTFQAATSSHMNRPLCHSLGPTGPTSPLCSVDDLVGFGGGSWDFKNVPHVFSCWILVVLGSSGSSG